MSALDLAVAKDYLNISSGDRDAALQRTIDAAESAIGEHVGPLSVETHVSRLRPRGGVLLLEPPVVELVSVADAAGNAIAAAAFDVDPESGVAEPLGGRLVSTRYIVTYTRGRATCPPDLLEAVQVLVKHLWAVQRGTGGKPGASASEGASNTLPGASDTLPFRVESLIAPHRLVVG